MLEKNPNNNYSKKSIEKKLLKDTKVVIFAYDFFLLHQSILIITSLFSTLVRFYYSFLKQFYVTYVCASM